MSEFDPAEYGPAVAELFRHPRLPELGRGTPVESAKAILDTLTLPPAVAAGLYLHFDLWQQAHEIAQDLDTNEGSYWHAIQHRREPDAGNAKYWFRQVTRHPVALAMAAESGYGSPAAFVDLCERVRGTGGEAESRARELQGLEWRRLMGWCQRQAGG